MTARVFYGYMIDADSIEHALDQLADEIPPEGVDSVNIQRVKSGGPWLGWFGDGTNPGPGWPELPAHVAGGEK